jgi:hypothetical protein
MGHSNNKIVQSYMSSVVGINTQSIVFGRPQQKEMIESHTSMMSSRQLLAPKPPGSQLVDAPVQDTFRSTAKSLEPAHDSIAVADLSPAQEYELRRQSRKRMYHKQRETFFKNGIRDLTPAETLTCILRSPLRYLQALLKHEPQRRKAAMMLYPDAFLEDNSSSATTSDDEPFLEDNCSWTGSLNEGGSTI